jgi:hypothetical protein
LLNSLQPVVTSETSAAGFFRVHAFVASVAIGQPRPVSAGAAESRYRFFDAKTAATFRAAAACIIPAEPGSEGGGCEQVLRVADRMLAARPLADQRKVAAFLRALELLPLLRHGKRFSALRTEQRERVLSFLGSTRLHPLLRIGTFGVKTYALMGYYGAGLAWAEMRYPGPRADAPQRSDVQGAP